MKKAMILSLFAVAAVAVHAEPTAHKNQVVTTPVAAAQLTADEQAFAAKLSDQNRRGFCEKLSQEQRFAAMVAVKNGAEANDAVSHLITAQELKASAVVDTKAPAMDAVK